MALTPEQVLNKHFQTTQFRRGYEERDVDDFLDEIVAEMRSLIEQRDDYLKQLNDCRASKNQGAVRADGATAAMPVVGRPGTTRSSAVSRRRSRTPSAPSRPPPTAPRRRRPTRTTPSGPREAHRARQGRGSAPKPQRSRPSTTPLSTRRRPSSPSSTRRWPTPRPSSARLRERARAPRPRPAPPRSAPRVPRPTPRLRPSPAAPPPRPAAVNVDAANVIALAQRLHDEHVAAGESRRNELSPRPRDVTAELLSGTGQARRAHHDRPGRHEEVTRQAEQLVPRATAKRDQMLSEATAQRDKMLAEAAAQRDQMLTEARERSTGMVAEAQQKKAALLEGSASRRACSTARSTSCAASRRTTAPTSSPTSRSAARPRRQRPGAGPRRQRLGWSQTADPRHSAGRPHRPPETPGRSVLYGGTNCSAPAAFRVVPARRGLIVGPTCHVDGVSDEGSGSNGG